ncbi:hypothetical protein HDV57DRAFT_150127 [Trichoderma longibrachiatum]
MWIGWGFEREGIRCDGGFWITVAVCYTGIRMRVVARLECLSSFPRLLVSYFPSLQISIYIHLSVKRHTFTNVVSSVTSPRTDSTPPSHHTSTHTHTQWPDEPSTSTPSTTPPPAATLATRAASSPSSRASCARPRRGSRAAGPASRHPRLRSRPSKSIIPLVKSSIRWLHIDKQDGQIEEEKNPTETPPPQE